MGFFSIFLPARSKNEAPSFLRTAISPSSMKTALRVCARKAGTSEARKVSPSPSPMMSGEAVLAATMTPGAFDHRTAKA